MTAVLAQVHAAVLAGLARRPNCQHAVRHSEPGVDVERYFTLREGRPRWEAPRALLVHKTRNSPVGWRGGRHRSARRLTWPTSQSLLFKTLCIAMCHPF